MSSQQALKKKSKRGNGLFCVCSECTCVDATYFVPISTSAYHKEKHKAYNSSRPLIRVFLQERMRNPLYIYHYRTHLKVSHWGNNYNAVVHIRIVTKLSGRKGSVTYGLGAGISLSPCLPTGIWNLAPKATSRLRTRQHRSVRRPGTTSSGYFALVFCWRMSSYHRTAVLIIVSWRK